MGRPLIARLARRQEAIFHGAAALVLGGLVLAPLACVTGQLASSRAALEQARTLLASARTWLLLARSLGLAGAVTALALVLGVPLGILLGRTDVPGRRLALLLHALPLFLPPFLLALGWFALWGQSGLFGSAATSRLLFSTGGAIALETLAFTPVVTLLVALALHGIDPSLEEAARVVAAPGRIAVRILAPLSRPAIALGALVVFSLALSELGVPMFLRVDAYPAAVFARLGGIAYAPGEAVALVLPLLAVALLLLGIERRWMGRRSFAVLGLRSAQPWILPLARWRWAAAAASWLAAAISVAPLGGLLWRAGLGGLLEARLWVGTTPWNSLLAAVLSASLAGALAIVVGRALARRRRGAALLDAVAVLSFLTPAAVLGVGLIGLWNRPATRLIYGSVAMLAVGLSARYAVIGVRTVAVALSQSAPELEEAAAAFGARFARRIARIVLPLHKRGLAAAWLLTAVFCLRDLETVVLFYPPGWEPLSVRIFTLEANGPERVVAALALLQVAMTTLAVGLGAAALLRRRA